MKKKLLVQLIALLVLIIGGSVKTFGQGFLKADGTKIVSENGDEVIFKGIGLGGWMIQEGYMLNTTGPQYKIKDRIEALVGTEKKQEFYDAWLANHTRKIDVDSLASWGFNLIRLPMHYNLFTPPIEEEPVPGEITWLEKGFEMTDQLLAWCKENNVYLILDLHATPGGQGENADINDYDPTKPSLWESEANQEKMIALWKKLAERYADEPMIGGYDIINEPNWGFQNHDSDPNGCAESENAPLWDLEKKVTAAIREVDQKHIIIIEGNCWGNNYAGLPELWDNNMAFSFHKYWNANNQAAIQGMINLRNERNVPLWLGESGENSNTWFTDAISLVEENGVGWAWWPLKKMGNNNPLEIKVNAGYQAILDYWNGTGEKPSVEDAFSGLMQLTENIKLENNSYHKDVVDAMIRQPHSEEAIPFIAHTISASSHSIIFAVDYDLGKHNIAYHDADVSNTTGNAGGLTWNQGYAYRNDGVDIQPNEDVVSNGYNVGWTETGEWLQYTVNVEETGLYTLFVRSAATGSEGKISLFVNGSKATEAIALPNTGGYQTWETTKVEDVYLKSGKNSLKVNIDQGGFNLNYLEFSKQDTPASDQPKVLDGSINNGEKVINLVFNQPFDPIPASSGFTVKVNESEAVIEGVQLQDGEDQVIAIFLQESIQYGDEITVSYSGTTVATSYGVALAAFSDYEIEVLSDFKVLNVPGKIEMEDFTVNNGFEFETTTDAGGGQNAGYTDFGDYLDFSVLVDQTGYYSVKFRVASLNAGGALKLQKVNENGSAQDLSALSFDATGGWQTWKTFSGGDVYLEAGFNTLRVMAQAATFNINYLELAYLYEEQPLGINKGGKNNELAIYPNPSNGHFNIVFKDASKIPAEVMFYDITGNKVYSYYPKKKATLCTINTSLKNGFYYVAYNTAGKKYIQKIIIN